jgi:nitrate/nitrite transport system substrate-binding protein
VCRIGSILTRSRGNLWASDARKVMTDLGYDAPAENYKSHMIMGKTFDYNEPEAYIDSFAIKAD